MNRIKTRLRVGAVWRRSGVLCYFLGLTAVISPGIAAAQSIVPDGRTATTVSTQGSVSSVTTSTVRGANAFNSFSTFNVSQGATANLYLPSGTANLVNLVRDARSDIYGVVNSIRDGRIGGNVWFANPHGVVVGATGVFNVGGLTLTTPTQAFVDGFFVGPGNPNDASVAQLPNGTAPRSTGMVSVQDGIESRRKRISIRGLRCCPAVPSAQLDASGNGGVEQRRRRSELHRAPTNIPPQHICLRDQRSAAGAAPLHDQFPACHCGVLAALVSDPQS